MVRLEDTQKIILLFPQIISIPLWYDWKLKWIMRQGVFMRNFNSTMVRLEAFVLSLYPLAYLSFQFHYGTIGRRFCIQKVVYCFLFQFHYGTIGRGVNEYENTYRAVFQFHYGTIGR